MNGKQIKSKTKRNSKIKYETLKPNYLNVTKPDKYLQKNANKFNIDNQNKKKMEQIKVKINLLQEMLSNDIYKAPKKNKSSLSNDKITKNNKDKKYNSLLEKNTSNVNSKKNNLKRDKSPNNTNSDNFHSKFAFYDSFNVKYKSDIDKVLDKSDNVIGMKNNKDYFSKKQKKNVISIKKMKYVDYNNQDLTDTKISNIRNIGNYSIDKENTSIDKSINFNQINKDKENKNNIIKSVIHQYNQSNNIKFQEFNTDNNKNEESILYSKMDKIMPQSVKNIEEDINSIKVSNNTGAIPKDDLNLNNNHSSVEQIETKNFDNISKETPSTKYTIKIDTRITDNILSYKHNKIISADNSIKNSGRKKRLNKSVNKILIANKSKILPTSSNKNILVVKTHRVKKNHSYENRNKYSINTGTNKNKNLNNSNNNIKTEKGNTNITNLNFMDINTSPFMRNKYNQSNKNINKNVINLKKGPVNCKLNFNTPLGYYNFKKEYEIGLEKKNKNLKTKYSSFNISQSSINKNQQNNSSINNLKNNHCNMIKINKTEKNSKTNTYKNNMKMSYTNSSNLKRKTFDNKMEKEKEKNVKKEEERIKEKEEKKEEKTKEKEKNLEKEETEKEKEKEKEEEEDEKEHIPHVFSVSLRQSGYKQKEYPNMAKSRLSSSQREIIFKKDNFEKLKNNIYRETKFVKSIESLCKKGFAGPGIKKTNQDNFFIFNNFNNNSNYIYMGVCDGHGIFGQDISSYLVNNLPQNLNKDIINKNIKNLSTEKLQNLSKILESTFVQTNINLNTDERIDSTFSGSTCVTVLFTPTRLICINVGDSRCVMGKFSNDKWYSKNLTRDHKPSEPDEMDRIIAAGGKVEAYRDNEGNFVGPERVWKKEGDVPGLAMSRSFGDEVAHTVGVIVNPEIDDYQLLNEDKFIILASDGIWEFISSEEVVNIVKDFYLENNIEGALTYLYNEASKRWIMEEEIIDDITIILVFLN